MRNNIENNNLRGRPGFALRRPDRNPALVPAVEPARWAGAAAGALLAVSGLAGPGVAMAQDDEDVRRGSAQVLIEEIVTTARKREESSQEVPLSVSAYSADQIDALKVRELTNLSVGMPNVALDDIGTTRGTANFSIRGLGVNSSIPSIDPTVGVFVNGVYMGLNNGIIFDVFDLQSIEVLRGPQGTLFGRNVTGGAVLMRTKLPGDELEFTARAAVDGRGGEGDGLNRYLMAAVSGPLSDRVGARVSVYSNVDDGWFKNSFNGQDFGEQDTWVVRPTLTFAPSDTFEIVLRYEHMETDGDGPAAQTHTNGSGVPGSFVNFDRNTFDFSIDEEGRQETETDFFTAEFNWDVDFGEGTITNIFGWRDYEGESVSDIDAQPVWLFHAPAWLLAEQYSNELRYNGRFNDNLSVTTGLFYFTNDIEYHERRNLLGIATGGVAPAANFDGGGLYEVDSWTFFASFDYDYSDTLTLSAGINYSSEEKEAAIAEIPRNVNTFCRVLDGNCTITFNDKRDWDSFGPKLGFTYHIGDDSRLYGHWSRGFRSGGYNLRNTSLNPANVPGPFDEEQVDNFEIGYKSSLGGRGRFNVAAFFNQIDDMQRELNLPSEGFGVVQLIQNTADAEILGLEVDATVSMTDNLVFLGSVGYIDADYTSVSVDLNGDGSIDDGDKNLDLPRAADLTWSLGFTLDNELGDLGYLTSRISYSHRDKSFYNDNNQGFINEQDILDAGLDFYSPNGHWTFSLYGRNLLNEVKHGGDTNLPNVIGPVPTGGTFSPLAKGRVIGLEVTYTM